MSLFEVIAILLTLTALFSYVNHRYIRLPTSVGVMLVALVMSLGLLALGGLGLGLKEAAGRFLAHVDLNEALLRWMLGFLLFAGALHVDLGELSRQRGLVAVLAIAGTVLSMFIIGGLTFLALRLAGAPLPLLYCILFGALISPTDPVAVIGLMKTVQLPKETQTTVTSESLFNDGVGVVLFITLLGIARHDAVSVAGVTRLFLQEAFGGVALGLVAGFAIYQLLKRIDNYQTEVLLTLSLVMGTAALGELLHVSSPLAAVVSGLLIGNQGRALAMSSRSRQRLDDFWELIDEILNAVLFVIVGLQLLVTPFSSHRLLATLLIVPGVLLARWSTVAGTIRILSARQLFSRLTVPLLTWGGLRGGLSIAMALSLPPSAARDTIVTITYVVVVFSILVQGTTINAVIRHYDKPYPV